MLCEDCKNLLNVDYIIRGGVLGCIYADDIEVKRVKKCSHFEEKDNSKQKQPKKPTVCVHGCGEYVHLMRHYKLVHNET